ncbi:hypothetical protein GPX89_05475 [Nocardia sp. ET3-3]|uniref:Uncharacterized protein n=1 Tax=Nocardia terrae TaxID=2675851 RepID=A0A7K1UQR9_9NOCA|nr:hypothetical protein [Nocardia terrae]MVU76695.1 hypothetical protein [Nocardia terrae]
MATPTDLPDRWRTYLTWWRFWGAIGFCLTFFLSFLIISDMEGVPAFCGWRHPCSPLILGSLGTLPIYVWAAGGAISWYLGRFALSRGRTPAWGIIIGALVFLPGVILSLYLVAAYWWPDA